MALKMALHPSPKKNTVRAPFDPELVLRARAADRQACEDLLRHFLRPAYMVALAIVKRPADADDVAQEAMATVFQKMDDCRDVRAFPGWLMQIVRNHALNLVDRRRLRDVATDPEAPLRLETPGTEAGMRKALVAALDELTPGQREVLLLHDLEEWNHGEIAEALGISELMSRQHLFQARKRMRERLEETP